MSSALAGAVMRVAVGRLLALALVLGVASSTSAVGPVTICHGSEAAALVPLARLQGLYAAEGLEVETRHCPSDFQALAAMLAGDCALATAAVPPVVFQALENAARWQIGLLPAGERPPHAGLPGADRPERSAGGDATGRIDHRLGPGGCPSRRNCASPPGYPPCSRCSSVRYSGVRGRGWSRPAPGRNAPRRAYGLSQS